MKLLFATNNTGKLRELKALVGDLCDVVSPKDIGLFLEVEEDADTFEGNARKKAVGFMEASGLMSLADDSGLCVEALGGAPGVHSARYGTDDGHRIDKLLRALENMPIEKRQAHFECVLCLALPKGKLFFEKGQCHGQIAMAPSGQGGFGYDPIFYLPSLGRTLAEVSVEEKARVSHRGRAFEKMLLHLRELAKNA